MAHPPVAPALDLRGVPGGAAQCTRDAGGTMRRRAGQAYMGKCAPSTFAAVVAAGALGSSGGGAGGGGGAAAASVISCAILAASTGRYSFAASLHALIASDDFKRVGHRIWCLAPVDAPPHARTSQLILQLLGASDRSGSAPRSASRRSGARSERICVRASGDSTFRMNASSGCRASVKLTAAACCCCISAEMSRLRSCFHDDDGAPGRAQYALLEHLPIQRSAGSRFWQSPYPRNPRNPRNPLLETGITRTLSSPKGPC